MFDVTMLRQPFLDFDKPARSKLSKSVVYSIEYPGGKQFFERHYINTTKAVNVSSGSLKRMKYSLS